VGFEHEAFRKDGTRIWSLSKRTRVRNEHGAIAYYEGTVQDISERKRAEKRVACFTVLVRRLSGVTNPLDAAKIIVDTAADLFWLGLMYFRPLRCLSRRGPPCLQRGHNRSKAS